MEHAQFVKKSLCYNQEMKDIEIRTIYNVPEVVSGIGYISHFIGLCLYIFLFVFNVFAYGFDIQELQAGLKADLQLIQDSGLFVILGMSFIFILCPIYFFVRFFMELFRTKKAKYKFYSTPNIEYITFNDDNLFFKNTIKNNDVLIKKSDIIDVELKGIVRTITGVKKSRTPLETTFIEHLTLTIETKDEKFVIYPNIKVEQIKRQLKNIISYIEIMDIEELTKLQIDLYKKHFTNFSATFKSDNDYNSTLLACKLNDYAS